MFDSLAEYPHWFVVACAVLAGAGLLWLMLKLLKMAMWTLFFVVLAAAAATAAGLFFR